MFLIFSQVLTYIFNIYAEWYKQKLRSRSIDFVSKQRFISENINDQSKLIAIEKEYIDFQINRSRILFEVIIPSLSVSCLLIVTVYVSFDAVGFLFFILHLLSN